LQTRQTHVFIVPHSCLWRNEEPRIHLQVAALRAEGVDVALPRAGMYLWLALPPGVDDEAFCEALVAEK
jgi:aspartate/methionine/tyrosine aminotransferase